MNILLLYHLGDIYCKSSLRALFGNADTVYNCVPPQTHMTQQQKTLCSLKQCFVYFHSYIICIISFLFGNSPFPLCFMVGGWVVDQSKHSRRSPYRPLNNLWCNLEYISTLRCFRFLHHPLLDSRCSLQLDANADSHWPYEQFWRYCTFLLVVGKAAVTMQAEEDEAEHWRHRIKG